MPLGHFIAWTAVAAMRCFVILIWRLRKAGVPPLQWPKGQYFNPQVRWKKLWNRAPLEDLVPALHQVRASGKAMWFDLAALERLSSDDASFSDWLKANCRLCEKHQFKNADELVGFVPLNPENSINHRNAN